jgi:hypothetical protein
VLAHGLWRVSTQQISAWIHISIEGILRSWLISLKC